MGLVCCRRAAYSRGAIKSVASVYYLAHDVGRFGVEVDEAEEST